ncbi:MAG: carboxymuconolactone decarboxylase family protein [Pseudomonadota bacterium]
MSAPRLPTIDPAEAPEKLQEILTAWPYNIHKTLSHSPDMLIAWMGFAEHVLLKSSLSERDREIVILRIAWNAQSEYEWGMHTMVARRVGMDEADIEAAIEGPSAARWAPHESALVSAVDEIMSGWKVSDATWSALAQRYTPENLVDFTYLVGQFLLVALTLNTLQIEPEAGLDRLPKSP